MGLNLPSADVEVLRELGRRKAEAAVHPDNINHAELWTRTNDLQMTKPPIFIDEICWHEFICDELALRSTHPFARKYEELLRRELYRWEHLRASMVISPFIECPMALRDSGFGIDEVVDTIAADESSDIVSRHFHILMENMDDITKIQDPIIVHDEEETRRNYEMLLHIFDGILPVKIVGAKGYWFTPWDNLIRVTGIEEAMINLIEEPEFINALVERFVDASIISMQRYNELGAWSSNNTNMRVGSGGYGYCSALAPVDFDNMRNVPAKELWGCGNAQIFSEVSPDMHWEFSIRHELRWIEQFGLSYYGCCEPLHHKLHILERIPNLRKVSMSPWAKLDEARELCKGRYVMSCKPSPATFVGDTLDEAEAVRAIRTILEQSKGCSIEIVMKDISTVGYHPEKLWRWAQIAQDVVNEFY